MVSQPNKLVFNLLIFLWVVALLFQRPSIVGSYFNKEVFFVFSVLTVVIIIFSKNHSIKVGVNKAILYILFFITSLYFLIQGLILSESTSTVINSSLLIILLIIVLFLMSKKPIAEKLIHYFVLIHFILSVTLIISLLLLLIFDFNKLTVYIFKGIEYGDRYIVFPFTVFWSKANIFGYNIPRFTAIYKEPGIAQAFFLTAFWLSVAANYNKAIRLFLMLGTIFTFSTAGLINIIISTLIYIISSKKLIIHIIRKPFISILGLTFLIILTVFSLKEIDQKKISNSGQDRYKSYYRSLEVLSKNPILGTGYYSSRDNLGERIGDTQSLGIIGVAFQIGYLGLILYFGIWIYSIFVINKAQYLFIYIPFFITILLFQPSYNSSIIWVLLSFNFVKLFSSYTLNKHIHFVY